MERKNNNEKSYENKDTKDTKEHHHHHHHNRKLSVQNDLHLKTERNKNKDEKKKSLIINTNIKEKDDQKKEQKHHRHRHRNSSVGSQKEKNYIKNKLDNFGKKRYKISDINNKIPKNAEKNSEKYYKQLQKKKEKEKSQKMKTESNSKNESNSKKHDKDVIQNNKINYNDYINQSNNKDKIKTQKNIDKSNQYNVNRDKIGENTKKISDKDYKDNMFNNLSGNKTKSKYFQNNEYNYSNEKKNKNKIIEGEFSINQDNINNNYNYKIEGYKNSEKKGMHGRKGSMAILSKYSGEMQKQIAEEGENIMKEKVFEKRKSEVQNSNELLKNKESYAQEYFIKTYLPYLSQYVDYGKIASRIQGGYDFLQSKLIYLDLGCTEDEFNYIYNKKNFYKSKNAKELCRKGIPLKYMKLFFKKLLNLGNYNENYNVKYSMIIKDINPKYFRDYVPYFCGLEKLKLKEILPVHYLNEEGILQLKVIMWLIVDLVPKIEYCPLLVKLCSILLIFLEKEEVYEAMRTLIEMNYRPSEIYKLRWHFRYSFFENNKLSQSIKIFLENESDNMKNLFELFLEKGLEPHVLINDFCESLFMKYLNFYGLLRFICIFIYEGAKTLYRFSYGLLNYVYEEKLDVIKKTKNNNVMHEIREIICGITDYKKIIQDCFNLQVTRANNGYVKNQFGEDIEELEKPFEENTIYNDTENDINIYDIDNDNNNNRHKENNYLIEFYLPTIEPTSNILSSKEIIQLWPKLPTRLKKSNLATIYSLSKKKVNMKSLIELSKKYPTNYPILFLIETEQNELFGVILPRMLTETDEKEYIQLDKCCLVNFRPKINVYKDNFSKGIDMLCCNKKGLWFCKEEVGDLFYIDGTLSEGRTCKNNTYFGQVCLTRKENFLVKDLEIIVFANNAF